jgi:hypothetical protein
MGSLWGESWRVCSRDVRGPNATPGFPFGPRMISANKREAVKGGNVQGLRAHVDKTSAEDLSGTWTFPPSHGRKEELPAEVLSTFARKPKYPARGVRHPEANSSLGVARFGLIDRGSLRLPGVKGALDTSRGPTVRVRERSRSGNLGSWLDSRLKTPLVLRKSSGVRLAFSR